MEKQTTLGTTDEPIDYRIDFDGSSQNNPGPSGAGFVISGPSLDIEGQEPLGEKTNNEAEYLALIAGLRRALEEEIERVEVKGDSQLIIKQVKGLYNTNKDHLLPLRNEAQDLLSEFDEWQLSYQEREENARADRLATEAAQNN